MPIVDKYTDMGTVVIGKVESGQCSKGQTLAIYPNRTEVKVDQVEQHTLLYFILCLHVETLFRFGQMTLKSLVSIVARTFESK